jgi:hypothetical protein
VSLGRISAGDTTQTKVWYEDRGREGEDGLVRCEIDYLLATRMGRLGVGMA